LTRLPRVKRSSSTGSMTLRWQKGTPYSCALLLREWDPAAKAYTGRQVEKKVTFVLPVNLDKTFWSKEELLEKGLVILSLE
jgi:hypothetical protein